MTLLYLCNPIATLLLLLVVGGYDFAGVVEAAFSAAFFKGPSPSLKNSKKADFLESLDLLDGLNEATAQRTELVRALCDANPTGKPGCESSFLPDIAPGEWRVVYAPHMSAMGKLVQGEFSPVIYHLDSSKKITSHARVTLPIVGTSWLSVSGTYGSEDDDRVCKVNFQRSWMKRVDDDSESSDDDRNAPYRSLEEVPESVVKDFINRVGKLLFIEQFAVFPVSYLDDDLIVFDFELLGTRITSRKVA